MNYSPCMDQCPGCPEQRAVPRSSVPRSRFFNWITVTLVTLWVVVIAVVAESSRDVPFDGLTGDEIVRMLAE